MKWLENAIEITPPAKPKKLTATRFATVLGLNPWSTPFEVWCEVTRTYAKPFEDTIYTIAGKTIEPKQIEFMKKAYFMTNLKTPTDIYGKDYFKKTYGDFYKNEPIFGGMWDSLLYDENDKPYAVLEFKTTKRAEDWRDDVPEYYALQAALYAYLLGVDNVIMVASFLEPSDYDNPDAYVCTVDNTITVPFRVSERYPHFEQEYVYPAENWWKAYVERGISPAFDEKKDAELLKALRHTDITAGDDLSALIAEAESLQAELDGRKAEVADKEKRLKALKEAIKNTCVNGFKEGDTTVTVKGGSYEWTVQKTSKTDIDRAALEKDGLLEKYQKQSTVYKLTSKIIKEEK